MLEMAPFAALRVTECPSQSFASTSQLPPSARYNPTAELSSSSWV